MNKIKENDRKYGLNFAPFAEDLSQKFTKDQQEFRDLRKEIDNGSFIAEECQTKKFAPLGKIKGSGGHYMRFGNNKIQDIIQKQQVEIAKRKT
jgi:hypothetical protein